jgi:hypothetical protein
MLAHRVGTLGSIVAVVLLCLELAGALVVKHRALAPDRHDRWSELRGTELVLTASRAYVRDPNLDSTLEDVTLARRSLER